MCAQFIVGKTGQELARLFKAKAPKPVTPGPRALPRSLSPVVLSRGGERMLMDMEFGLVPAWSDKRRPAFATHNARLWSEDGRTSISQKPTWRDAFAKRHCLVPMTGFIEPLYTGPLAGHMVQFFPTKEEVLAAAGLWETWTSKTTGETVDTFTILTDDPDPHIAQMGHDRTPVFLTPGDFDDWLAADRRRAADWLTFLKERRAVVDWGETVDRPLKHR